MMKKNIVLLLLPLALISARQASAFVSGDTLLVYFSDNENINLQYYNMLKLKFPQMNLVCISGKEDFNRYIPEKYYQERISSIGVGANMPHEKSPNFPDLSTSSTKDYKPVNYYFFDIKSEKKSGYYQTSNPNGQGGTINVYYTQTIHELELVNFKGNSFGSEKMKPLTMNDEFYNRMAIPLSSMDSASDWINPVYVSMYLAAKLNPKILQTRREDLTPCDIGKKDTVYLCEILNREHVARELKSSPKEKKFKKHLKYFKHMHIKLHNNEFASKAIQNISNQKHFFYYYYDYELSRFFIMDALDFKVIYFPKTWRQNFHSKRYIRRCSNFSKKCKHLLN